ncbi:MAG TPA: rhodanese-like domain-containing protein, partial [Candidatus Thermoplasmatota archaeon]|nr:rhodanese-like domain-containing protein [Candidatus Thermoplasmatota archaeon]
ALEAIKLLAGLPPLAGLLLWDGRTGATESVALKRREGCPAHVSTPPEQGPACPLPWNAPEALDIPVHELAPHLGEFFLLDVREPDEHEEFHLPGSTLIPLGQLPRRRVELPRGRPIAVYCAVGGRSARATDFLRAQGFDAVNVRGGVRAWRMMQAGG